MVMRVPCGGSSRSRYRRRIGMGRRPWLWVAMLRIRLAMVAANAFQ
jgi:hypothetical protein